MQPSRPVSYLRWATGSPRPEIEARAFYRTLAASSGVLTGRFHAVMFCLHSKTPFLAVASNTSKIQDALLDATGQTGRIIAAQTLDDGYLDIPAFSREEIASIDAYINAAETGAKSMFDRIALAAG
jgi:hypothetical protein